MGLWVLLPFPVAFVQMAGSRGAAQSPWNEHARALDWIAYILILLGPVALFAAWRYPRTVVGITVAAASVYYSFGYPSGPLFLAVIAALFLWLRKSRAERAEAQRAVRRAERARQAGAERLRIAQELHDVLAHHISLINVQAGVALHIVDEHPEQARTALTAIKGASKEALGELRAALDALRNPGDSAPRAPTVGLSDLPAIVDSVRAAGLPVSLRTEGAVRPLSTAVELAALRIVQEALTNVVRHANASAAAVTVSYLDESLRLAVVDDGSGGTPVPGNGLSGMAERAGALGGDCTAGPEPDGGFAVRVELPG